MKKVKIVAIFVILSLVAIFTNIYADEIDATQNVASEESYKAEVVHAGEIYNTDIDKTKYQDVIVKIKEKEYKNQEFKAVYTVQVENGILQKVLSSGDTVFVLLNKGEDGKITATIEDLYRIPYLVVVVFIFFLLVIVIGGKQGIKTLISLIITTLSIFYILIPMIIKGHSAIWSSVLICTIISIITFIIIAGFKRKTLVAVLGTTVGVVISGVIAIIVGKLGSITGLGDCEAQTLIYVAKDMSIDLNGLLFAGILIATVGASMDIAMSISSAMTELAQKVKNISVRELIKSGMNIGKDAMGTMANTLIFAYVGESLMLIILLVLNGSSLINIINSDIIATEVLRGLCGTIGMISAIPITTFIFGALHKLFPVKRDIVEEMREKIKETENEIKDR